MNKANQLDTIYCAGFGVPVTQSNGTFLAKVIVVCAACRRRNEWHPQPKSIDKPAEKDDKADVTH
jgi:hypothetical protein